MPRRPRPAGGVEGPRFTLELNQDQKDIRDWVHGFAEGVVRPAAAEWDEREETPWPVIQEAAKIGLYGFEALGQFFADETGLTLPIANEELFWGDAGIGMAIMGTSLAVAAIFGQGTPEQMGEWIPQCFGTADDPKVGAFCSSEPDAGSDVAAIRTTAKYDEATDEWVLNGQKAWATNGGIADVHVVIATVDRELRSRGHAAFVIPPGTKGCEQGAKVKKHGLRASHTADVHLDDCRIPGSCLLGGKEKLDERLARVREGKSSKSQAAMATFEASRPTVGAQALGIARAAYEYALEYAKERAAVRQGDHREPGDRLHPRRHEDGDRRRPAARLARRLDGAKRAQVRERRGLDVEAEGRRGGRLGDRAGDPDPRRQRLHARVPGRADAPRRQDLHDLRGHLRDPAPGDLPRDLRRPDPLATALALRARLRLAQALARLRTSFLSGPFLFGPGVSRVAGSPSKRGSDRKAARPPLAHLALADVGVAVAAGTERRGGIVYVQAAEAVEADLLVGFVDYLALENSGR